MSSEPVPTNRDPLGAPGSIDEEETTHSDPGKPKNDSEQEAPFPQRSGKDLSASSTTLDNEVQHLESPRPEENITPSTSLADSKIGVSNKEEENNLIDDDGDEPTDSDEEDFPRSEDVPRGPLKGQVTGQKPKPKPKP